MSMHPVTGRVLPREDNARLVRLWVKVLEHAGHQVVGPVSSAAEALERAYRDLPDVALIDIGLSGMGDGISVAAELAPLGVPVVLVSDDYRRASTEGWRPAADILIKPVSPFLLTRSVQSVSQQDARPRQG
jgi:CheY-like chemotaxis protein